MAELIVALDYPSAEEAHGLVDELGDAATFYKVGLELYTAAGPPVVRELVRRGKRVFLDLKLHDIPRTVARTVRVASGLGVDMLTIHVTGGSAMLAAAAGAAEGVRLLGVTVLTSLSTEGLGEVWGRRIGSAEDEVARLADLAVRHGLGGVVASPLEAARIRSRVERDFAVVTPGVRPAGSELGDQTRVTTPAAAVEAGAD